ncbi:MAG: TetR/AcrR family transcriptional regulator [Microthrixaceae bacterium]|nr:TetR/AcrR family transcriptional regulator [Microthrixaceae bacterium]
MTTTTRQRILEEATRQLLDGGYDRFTVASVRDALGLSSGSMFHAFPSKAALAAEVYVAGMIRYQQAAIDSMAGRDPHSAIEGLVATHLSWVSDHRRLARFLFSTQPSDVAEAAAPALAEANQGFFKVVADLMAEAAAAGLAAPMPVAVAHSLVIGPAQQYCRRWTRGDVSAEPRSLIALYQAAALQALRSTI